MNGGHYVAEPKTLVADVPLEASDAQPSPECAVRVLPGDLPALRPAAAGEAE
jgi:hypothetical protein